MQTNANWNPPPEWLRITSIDAHTAGEPLRVLTGGYPELPGDTILSKRQYARENLDYLRKALMWEPRGHADMYGCIVTEPVTPDGTLGVLFLHNEGYSTMCGHGIIGLAKVALDTGMIVLDGDDPVIKMDTPAGRVTAFAHRKNGSVAEVDFHNVPSFVYALDKNVNVPGIGDVRYDVAFGGAFYAFCRAEDFELKLTTTDFRKLIDIGMRIKHAVTESLPIEHPFEPDLGFLYGTIFVGEPHNPEHHSRNVCIFADGEVDRCPTGTGVSARAAIHHARGELQINEPFIVESILGTSFTGEIVQTTTFGQYEAVIPKVTGSAHITGRNEWLIDPEDPLRDGFILR
jgi:trans-L-3-hydroxyproline dehydratase